MTTQIANDAVTDLQFGEAEVTVQPGVYAMTLDEAKAQAANWDEYDNARLAVEAEEFSQYFCHTDGGHFFFFDSAQELDSELDLED